MEKSSPRPVGAPLSSNSPQKEMRASSLLSVYPVEELLANSCSATAAMVRKRKLSTSQLSAHVPQYRSRTFETGEYDALPKRRVVEVKQLGWTDRVLGLFLIFGVVLPMLVFAGYAVMCTIGIGAIAMAIFLGGVSVVVTLGLVPLLPVLGATSCVALVVVAISAFFQVAILVLKKTVRLGASIARAITGS